ncbi:uncharacterized protein LOC126889320 [Diabrotica virgifera virgifera]|uniref:Uncharacterized protein LOC114345871 n=1 Tax=Diabrotica virgifera virgifera TaxID=50390 RepID=A0A6P7H1Z7_DIAVI|nr:uncharacterized protein LOC126889320 [Diabrotica virgifera virgifera]
MYPFTPEETDSSVKCQIEKVKTMSGKSPNSHKNEFFVFSDVKTALPSLNSAVSTTKDVGIQNGTGGILLSSALSVEHDKMEGISKFSNVVATSRCEDVTFPDTETTMPLSEISPSLKIKKRGKERRYTLNKNKKQKDKKCDEKDDDWIDDCMYYTLQCCECIII